VHKRSDPEKFFPTKMRITMIQVAKGAKYDPKLVPNLPGGGPAGSLPTVGSVGASPVMRPE
jgi:hypothetical protein